MPGEWNETIQHQFPFDDQRISKLRWSNVEHTAIDCEVYFHHLGEVVPFTATLDDKYSHSQEIFARCAAGEFGPVAPFQNEAP